MARSGPLVLMILDGWGYREARDGNAIRQAHTPTMDALWQDYPHSLLQASARAVGVPEGQMGNSEIGHLNIGAGRVVYQEYMRINRAIETGSFFSNPELVAAVDGAKESGKALHLLGLVSDGGVHSHQAHIGAMLRLAVERGLQQVFVHAFLDGRDTPPQSARTYLERLQGVIDNLGTGAIASVVGRYYAMDRDRRWTRTQAAYDLVTQGRGYQAQSPDEAVVAAYERGETDEFVRPTAIVGGEGHPLAVIEDGDAVVFMNFRADRARQLTRALTEREFNEFARAWFPKVARFVCLTQYRADFPLPVAYPPQHLKRLLGECLAEHGLHQLRIAETEKYAHVTFFFNGGEESPFPQEERVLIPSPQVATYDQQPEMSAPELTDEVIRRIESGNYDVIVMNYANPDMVGHSGDFEATRQAVTALDPLIGRVVAAVQARGGELLIIADHGNAEQMRDPETGKPHTAHTTHPVPFIYIGGRSVTRVTDGSLQDVAPTILHLLGLRQPEEMTGHSLLQLQSIPEQAEGD